MLPFYRSSNPLQEVRNTSLIEHRAEFQTDAAVRGQEGIARDLGSYLAIAPDEVRQDAEDGFARRALYPPDGDPTHTEADIM